MINALLEGMQKYRENDEVQIKVCEYILKTTRSVKSDAFDTPELFSREYNELLQKFPVQDVLTAASQCMRFHRYNQKVLENVCRLIHKIVGDMHRYNLVMQNKSRREIPLLHDFFIKWLFANGTVQLIIAGEDKLHILDGPDYITHNPGIEYTKGFLRYCRDLEQQLYDWEMRIFRKSLKRPPSNECC